jgi:tRNA U34 5-carboxymethylaminomethyl modifying GTPase MnmE/TrmE
VLEFHVHGGPAVVKAVMTAIDRCNGPQCVISYAQPGEFTRRAFMNNRLDLPQIEALGDTLTAETDQQRRLAMRGTSDGLAQRYESWRKQLVSARGELEALIDFSEDQHFDESPQEFLASVATQVRALTTQLTLHIQNASKGELLRNGIKVALLGAPNAGKSSLLNQIVGKEAAIVSSEEGTTRDVVDVGVDLGGWFCRLGDMAGLRTASRHLALGVEPRSPEIGVVEQEGIRRAKVRAMESDVVIVILAVELASDGTDAVRLHLEPEVVDAVDRCRSLGKHIVTVVNKCDLLPPDEEERDARIPEHMVRQIRAALPGVEEEQQMYMISCKDAEAAEAGGRMSSRDPGNIQRFLNGLIANFEQMAAPNALQEDGENDRSYWQDSLGVTHRQRSNLEECLLCLNRFLAQTQDPIVVQDNQDAQKEKLKSQTTPSSSMSMNHTLQDADQTKKKDKAIVQDPDLVVVAEHLRSAADSLAKITGKGETGDVEEVLGVVFEK